MIRTKMVSPFVMTSNGKIVRIDSCVDDGMWLKASAGDVLDTLDYFRPSVFVGILGNKFPSRVICRYTRRGLQFRGECIDITFPVQRIKELIYRYRYTVDTDGVYRNTNVTMKRVRSQPVFHSARFRRLKGLPPEYGVKPIHGYARVP